MKTLIMYRKLLHDCAAGTLLLPNQLFHTIERPWIPAQGYRGGKSNVSCIPYGTYRLVKQHSVKYGIVWCLVNPSLGVYRYKSDRKHDTDRFACLMHIANYAHELAGCIAPGLGANYNPDEKLYMVTNSTKAMNAIRKEMDNYTHLEIKPYE